MGCGKSMTGVKLAARFSVEFIDLDEQITDMAGMSIEQIFALQGEHRFREIESRVLISLPENIVCALGGGTLMKPENLTWALNESWIIYLRVGVDELVRRLQSDKTVRPLLYDSDGIPLSGAQMKIKVHNLLGQRESVYNQAHQILDVDGVTPESAVEQCWEAYKSRNVRR